MEDFSSSPAAVPQVILGLINGAFYALLSLGPRGDLRHAERHQLRPRRAVHDGRLRGLDAADYAGIGYWPALILAPLIVGASAWRWRRLMISPPVQAGPPLRPAADLRLRAGDRGRVPQHLRLLRPALLAARGRSRALDIDLGFMFMPDYRVWVVVAALVVCLGDLAGDREDQARRLPARGDRERAGTGAGLRRQRAADDDADLRRRAWRWRPSPACWRRRSIR